jgi:hypothetical protein
VVCRAAIAQVILPVEVVGENGTTASVTVEIPAARAREIRALRTQIHNLAYPDMVSVQVNAGAWISLNNDTVSIAEPGKSYGGIGGGFVTHQVTLALPPDAVTAGTNTIRFRFNRSDSLASGFRVLSFNLLDADSHAVLPPETFVQEDPQAWKPPLAGGDAIRAGKMLWENAPLTPGEFKSSPMIRARCADCHARDGRDLKYFSFSNASIVARSRFHGLSEREGQQIASYIRSLDVPSPGRPWNPPYQPGPGLDSKPAPNWAAGAGLESVLENDTAALQFLPRNAREAFHPDANLNVREIPIAFQMPDWNHWLPSVHPLDAWGPAFDKSEAWTLYQSKLRDMLASPPRIAAAFDKWREARRVFLKPYVEGKSVNWTPALATKAYATELWQLVKTWELTQELGLETRGREALGPDAEPRTWLNTMPAAAAPATVNIPDGPSGMGGSALTNEYFDAAWYQLQIIVNSGNHRHRDRGPVDWVYVIGRFLDLYRETHRPEPVRVLMAVAKSMQSTDPRLGPRDHQQGWRPSQNVDPTIMVSAVWAPIFQALPADAKRAFTEALLAAWIDKNQQYSIGEFFTTGIKDEGYNAPAYLGGIAGGKVWESAPLFRAAGVSAAEVSRLQKWGAAYLETAARFQYSGNTRR